MEEYASVVPPFLSEELTAFPESLFQILKPKPMNTFSRKVGKAMVHIKRDWFDTALENYERGETYGRWKWKIQV